MPEELNSVASNVGQNILSEASSTYASVGEQTNIFLSSVRTYIAGVLMPTLAVSISASFDQSPTARITLPADPRLFNLGRLDKNCEIGWHVHHGDGETFLILSGEGEFNDNGTVTTVRAGDVCFTGDGEGHSMKNLRDEPLEYVALVLYN